MFKRRAIRKYGNKLLPKLQKRYGEQKNYNASQVRATIYQCDFNPKFLPLGYLLFLDKCTLNKIISIEFPELCIRQYKQDMQRYLDKHQYYGHLRLLSV